MTAGPVDPRLPDAREPDPAEVLAAVVQAVPGVVRLDGGPLGEIGTYLPGRRVPGIRRTADGTDVHLVVDQTADLRAVAERVHREVAGIVPGPVHVYIDDVAPAASPAPPEEL